MSPTLVHNNNSARFLGMPIHIMSIGYRSSLEFRKNYEHMLMVSIPCINMINNVEQIR